MYDTPYNYMPPEEKNISKKRENKKILRLRVQEYLSLFLTKKPPLSYIYSHFERLYKNNHSKYMKLRFFCIEHSKKEFIYMSEEQLIESAYRLAWSGIRRQNDPEIK